MLEDEVMRSVLFIQEVLKLAGHNVMAEKMMRLEEQMKQMLDDHRSLLPRVRELEAKIPGHQPIMFSPTPRYPGDLRDLEFEDDVLEHEADAISTVCCIWEAFKLGGHDSLAWQMQLVKVSVGRMVEYNRRLRVCMWYLEIKISGQGSALLDEYEHYRWLMQNRDQCTEAEEAWLREYVYDDGAWLVRALEGCACAWPETPPKKA